MMQERTVVKPTLKAWVLFLAFLACVPISNWMIANVGAECVEAGPCLIPVFPGILAPSGVLIAGASFILRDLVHEEMGVLWAAVAILAGGVISAVVSEPALAVASVASFLVAELVDLTVFSMLRKKGFSMAVAASSVVGLSLDSLIFVYLAFGHFEYVSGQILGKAWALFVLVPLLVSFRRRGTGSAI